MLQLKSLVPEVKEDRKKLGTIPKGAGSLVRFAEISFEEALKENAFYWVLEGGTPSHKDLVHLMPVDGKTPIVRDAERLVVVHDYELAIKPSS